MIIKQRYEDDRGVQATQNYLWFKAGGEYAKVPFESHKFRRFSSNLSGRNSTKAEQRAVEEYMKTIYRIARDNFGDRVRHWTAGDDQAGLYDWPEVDKSIRSYDEQPGGPEIPEAIAPAVADAEILKGNGAIFEIRSHAGKKRGMVARCDIAKGTRILCEEPLLVTRSMGLKMLEEGTVAAVKLKALTKQQQRQFQPPAPPYPAAAPEITRRRSAPSTPRSASSTTTACRTPTATGTRRSSGGPCTPRGPSGRARRSPSPTTRSRAAARPRPGRGP
ncbi:hypothetical protein DL769_009724 [Monosporascus sp. CRB-8-3]|nr:hypothetical protein DL769_009724 [Monosporascus sp. CRB-8-3]